MRKTLADEIARATARVTSAEAAASDLASIGVDKDALLEEAKTADGPRLKEILKLIGDAQAKASRQDKRDLRALDFARSALDRLEDQARLEADYLGYLVIPDLLAEMIYNKAYEDGHSSGFSEIEMIYADLSDLIRLAYDAGLSRAKELASEK